MEYENNISNLEIKLNELIVQVPSAFDPPGKELDSLSKECMSLGLFFRGRTGSNRDNTVTFVFENDIDPEMADHVKAHLNDLMNTDVTKVFIARPKDAVEYESSSSGTTYWWNDLPVRIDPKKYHVWLYTEVRNEVAYTVIETKAGSKIYTLDEMIHREDDAPAIVTQDGTKVWYKFNRVHRDIGPATIHADGSKEWINTDRLHRTDGPAIMSSAYKDWEFWIDGVQQNEPSKYKGFDKYVKLMNIPLVV